MCFSNTTHFLEACQILKEFDYYCYVGFLKLLNFNLLWRGSMYHGTHRALVFLFQLCRPWVINPDLEVVKCLSLAKTFPWLFGGMGVNESNITNGKVGLQFIFLSLHRMCWNSGRQHPCWLTFIKKTMEQGLEHVLTALAEFLFLPTAACTSSSEGSNTFTWLLLGTALMCKTTHKYIDIIFKNRQ